MWNLASWLPGKSPRYEFTMGRNYACGTKGGDGRAYRQPPGEGGALVGRQCLEASRPWGIQKARPWGLVEGLDWFLKPQGSGGHRRPDPTIQAQAGKNSQVLGRLFKREALASPEGCWGWFGIAQGRMCKAFWERSQTELKDLEFRIWRGLEEGLSRGENVCKWGTVNRFVWKKFFHLFIHSE